MHNNPQIKNLFRYIIFILSFVATFFILSEAIKLLSLPTYGVWTGNIPLENKLKSLREFSKNGSVDAIVMGSSIADTGFSSESFSEELVRLTGKEVRVFNMSTGAGDWQMFPILYKLVRLYANPKQIYIAHQANVGTGNHHDAPDTQWPDGQFRHSAAGKYINNEFLFKLSSIVYMSPIINSAGALRDLILYGNYKTMPASNFLTYPINKNGDKLTYMFMHDDAAYIEFRAKLKSDLILAAYKYQNNRNKFNCDDSNPFFSSDDLIAVKELRSLLNSSGASLTLVSQQPAVSYSIISSQYNAALKSYYTQAVECVKPDHLVYFNDFQPEVYEIEDTQHTNIHAARRFAKKVAGEMYGEFQNHTPLKFYKPKSYPDGEMFHHLLGVIINNNEKETNLHVTYYTFDLSQIDKDAMRVPNRLQIELIGSNGVVHIGNAIKSDGHTIEFKFDEALLNDQTAYISRLVELYPDGRKHYIVTPIKNYRWTV